MCVYSVEKKCGKKNLINTLSLVCVFKKNTSISTVPVPTWHYYAMFRPMFRVQALPCLFKGFMYKYILCLFTTSLVLMTFAMTFVLLKL